MFSVRVAALAFAILSPAGAENWWAWGDQDPVVIAEGYLGDFFPAFKHQDETKLMGLLSPKCIFGDSNAGISGSQKDVLVKGMKSTQLGDESKDFLHSLKAMKVMSAVVEKANDWETTATGYAHPIKVTAWVKLDFGESASYQWMVLVPFEGEPNGWTCTSVLKSPAPSSSTAELLELPVNAVGDARNSVAALPGSLALVATFASGVLLSGCFFGRKELFAKLTAMQQKPLL
jgi:hypothetical protein